jgi:pyruvate/2-oxoglutarate dehydrogenase complex dihydrolipoamide dehydrogenase (E3) component
MNGTNSSAKHYDMVVIGSGAAGHHGAIQAANLLSPTTEEIKDACPLATVLPQDVLAHAMLIAPHYTICAGKDDECGVVVRPVHNRLRTLWKRMDSADRCEPTD